MPSERSSIHLRELENVIQCAVLLTRSDTIVEKDLDPRSKNNIALEEASIKIDNSLLDRMLGENIALYEMNVIEASLTKWKGDTQQIADRLNISKTSLYEKMKRYGFSPKKFKYGACHTSLEGQKHKAFKNVPVTRLPGQFF